MDAGKYLQRYWVNEKSSEDTDLLFVEVCGEWTCDGPIDLPARMGKLYGARGVSLEHRFYGESMPTKDLSTESLRYLSSEQALEDLKSFLDFMYEEKPFKKVVLTGCSYAGGLVGWFAERYSQKQHHGVSFV